MANRVKDIATLQKKYVQRAGNATGDYKDGVAQAGGDWETAAKASEASYNQGVQQAITRGAFGKGVSAAGGAKYQQRAVDLGAQRYTPGINAGAADWAKNTQPYIQRAQSLNLPPRGPRRSPANQQRANMVALELGKMKEAGA